MRHIYHIGFGFRALRNVLEAQATFYFWLLPRRQNGLRKPTKWLASQFVGLGRVIAVKSKPKPKKTIWRGCKPKMSLSRLCFHSQIPRARYHLRICPLPSAFDRHIFSPYHSLRAQAFMIVCSFPERRRFCRSDLISTHYCSPCLRL